MPPGLCLWTPLGDFRPPDQSCAPTNWWSAAALGGLITGGGGAPRIFHRRRRRQTGRESTETAHSLDRRFFLALQGSTTSPVISAKPLVPKS